MTDFSFIQITDHHLLESEHALLLGFSPGHALRMVLRHISDNVADKADFILTTGDLTDQPTAAAYRSAAKLLGVKAPAALPGPQKINLEGLYNYPMYFLPGNHDDRELLAKQFFARTKQAPALYNYTFVHKGIQFICMDWGPESKAHLFPETREFLAKALEAERPSILICHQHVRPVGVGWLDAFLADDLDQFWEIVTRPPVKEKLLGILSGHVHMSYDVEYEGIPVLGLRSTAFPIAQSEEVTFLLAPAHYRLVTVQNGVLTSRIYQVKL